MLRVEVQSCKWQCLLCKITFSTKFCYALHCKNVHGKSLESSEIEASGIIENRPQERLKDEEKPIESERLMEESSNADDEESRKGAGKETEKDDAKRGIMCEVCKRKFSSMERLKGHKDLHSLDTKGHKYSLRVSKTKRGRRGRRKKMESNLTEEGKDEITHEGINELMH